MSFINCPHQNIVSTIDIKINKIVIFFSSLTVEVSGGGTPSRSTDWLGVFIVVLPI